MNNNEIVETYLRYRGKVRTKTGKRDNTLPLMPFFLMDIVYQIFCKDIKTMECKHQMQRYRTIWAENYQKFNNEFFRPFNEDQKDYVIDLMDEFDGYIHNTVVMMKSAVVNSFVDDAEFEDKKNLASLLTCNVLCQAAQHLYGDMYRDRYMRKETNPHIAAIQQASYKIACHYPAGKATDLTSQEQVIKMIDVLCKKIVKFLNVKENETES